LTTAWCFLNSFQIYLPAATHITVLKRTWFKKSLFRVFSGVYFNSNFTASNQTE